MPRPLTRPARARSPEEKLIRRGDILRAAERLWTTTAYADLSMNQVAREVQLAKGTLYLYFETKEELFLALLTEHYKTWITQLITLLDERQPKGADAVAGVICESLRGFEAMRRLQLLLGSVLEQGEPALEFRQKLIAMMQAAATRLPYPHDTALRVLVHTDALCVGWQHLAEESPAHRALTLHPELQPLMVNFETEMNTSLRALLHFLEQQTSVAVA
ncbi:TetR/AcrR family transcriptional regulator [Deinococcus irradiatisoli]|uniref:TetR/AcrR family transcriptional regulator n=1 Tax=Deinococcus irradiatisoli TaxID=2202254 RepID=A0A2Z3JGL9_9DEIO|nr:TetR family transcriptional regulator [Deinococcus irradiatisoli]AWN22641.1 TetR/AcrR family transcriptional regulator [Deinococcus irradiatisoli]